jgi:hypothetical protein
MTCDKNLTVPIKFRSVHQIAIDRNDLILNEKPISKLNLKVF